MSVQKSPQTPALLGTNIFEVMLQAVVVQVDEGPVLGPFFYNPGHGGMHRITVYLANFGLSQELIALAELATGTATPPEPGPTLFDLRTRGVRKVILPGTADSDSDLHYLMAQLTLDDGSPYIHRVLVPPQATPRTGTVYTVAAPIAADEQYKLAALAQGNAPFTTFRGINYVSRSRYLNDFLYLQQDPS